MALKRFKVLSFDVVGTLVDFERGMLNYLREIVPEATVTDDAFLEIYRHSRSSSDSGWFPDDLVRVWKDAANIFGLPDSLSVAQGFRDSVSNWPAFNDSVEALRRLRTRYKLVAMTNTQRWALKHFERILDYPFDDTVSSDDALCEKPDPIFFAFTRGRLSMQGFTLADTLHVAQSQYHDIGIAHRLGYCVCWIERRHDQIGFGGTKKVAQLTKPDYHFHSLAELADSVDAEEDS